MDDVLIDVYRQMQESHHCTADDIFCEPDLRIEFLGSSRERLKDKEKPESVLLRRLANLRKGKRLPRRDS